MPQPPTPLSPDLWVAQSDYWATNSGIFLSDGQAVLIDPAVSVDEIDAIARFVSQQGAEPKWLVLTHSHGDHVLGPERFPGLRTIAQARYLDMVARDQDRIAAGIAKWEADMGRTRQTAFSVPVPDETFKVERTLKVGRLALRLLHVPGHAADQLAVYEPERRCLWASDILSDLEIPFVSDSLAAYERTLATLAGYDVRLLVPGHGRATSDPAEIQARLADDRAYLAELRERVGQAVRSGKSVAEAVSECAGMRLRRPAENARPHQLNVESVFIELGGQADPRQVGWDENVY
jgi:glyoxylase-like metal-dependent hydrolase (beta-lactamase superfamily II)